MRVLVSWSSGKDSAWALSTLLAQGVEVAGLLTTLSATEGRVPMQWTPRRLVERQAERAGLPLHLVDLPWPTPNEVYAAALLEALAGLAEERGITHLAFGDLWLADVRRWREELLAGSGIEPLFPIWVGDPRATEEVASQMVASGLEATITCVDPTQADPGWCGARWEAVWRQLEGDPLGEQGELHTFCHAAPCFAEPVPAQVQAVGDRDGFRWADLVEA